MSDKQQATVTRPLLTITADGTAALLRGAGPQVNPGGAEGTRTPDPHTASVVEEGSW